MGCRDNEGCFMTKDVQLTICSEQISPEGESDSHEQVLQAQFFERNGSSFLLYEEALEDGQALQSHLKWKNKRVELVRKGALEAYMVFEETLRHRTEYQTPYGSLMLDVCTYKLKVEEKEDEIAICIEYFLEMGGEIFSRCRIKIKAVPSRLI